MVGVAQAVPHRAAWRRDWVDTGQADLGADARASLLAVAAVFAVWASPMLQSYDVGIHTFDSLYYHLPWAATFAQTGHITPLQYDIQYMLQFYPASAELLHSLGIVALSRDTLSPALNLLWFGLTLLSAWCIGLSTRVGGAPRCSARPLPWRRR